LRHLVVLAATRIVGTVKMSPAEILRGELYHVGHHPGVQPVVSKIPYLHSVFFYYLFNIRFIAESNEDMVYLLHEYNFATFLPCNQLNMNPLRGFEPAHEHPFLQIDIP
jgi:hypothetical protein